MLLYVHRDRTDRLDVECKTATSTFTQLLTSGGLNISVTVSLDVHRYHQAC